MGVVISLDERRSRRHGASDLHRLDTAVRRLDGMVAARADRLTATLERELRSIAAAVAAGRAADAADRAERLVGLLEHPAAAGS
jgi:hypothetical protein